MNLDALQEILGEKYPSIQKKDGLWMNDEITDVQDITARFVESGARFITMVAQPARDGEFQITYHWDVEGKSFHVSTLTQAGHGVSIASTCPAADWIEREIHDYYGIEFDNRQLLPPLILRSGDEPGLFSWKDQPAEEGQ